MEIKLNSPDAVEEHRQAGLLELELHGVRDDVDSFERDDLLGGFVDDRDVHDFVDELE